MRPALVRRMRLPAHQHQHHEESDHVATATCQPPLIHAPTERASGNRLVIATPADDPNQIIDPP